MASGCCHGFILATDKNVYTAALCERGDGGV